MLRPVESIPDISDPIGSLPGNQLWDAEWLHNNSSFAHYIDGISMAGGQGLTELVQHNSERGDIGLDVAGGTNAVALRDLLSMGVIERAVVTNFEDGRSEEVKDDYRVDHIQADLLKTDGWQQLMGWQQDHAPGGFGLILHRPHGALQDLRFQFYADAADILIRMLRPGGLFFTQLPSIANNVKRRELCAQIRARPDLARVLSGTRNVSPYYYAVLQKQPDQT